MKKIIIRKELIFPGDFSAAWSKFDGMKYKEDKEIIKELGLDRILKEIFNEKSKYEILEKSYHELLESEKKENDDFVAAYQIDNEFGLFLDVNIYLFHLPVQEGRLFPGVVPWAYADAKKYLGDTWWESDDEILQSIQTLSVIDFLKRYKGFIG